MFINISSIWGLKGASCESIYAASKAALVSLTRSLSNEYASSGIRVNTVAPGFIDTKMNACYTETDREEIRGEIPMGSFGTPEDVANTVYFLSEDGSGYITGQVIGVDGGWGAV